MRPVRYALIVLTLSVWISSALAASKQYVGLNEVIATVEKSFRPISATSDAINTTTYQAPPIADFAANFFQRTLIAADQREMRAEGQVTVKFAESTQPLMFKFEYFRPTEQQIISNGKSLWIYHPENREVILTDVSFLYKNPFRDPAVNFLQGLHRISRDFTINFAAGMYDAAGNYVLELVPRRSMLNTRRILMVVNHASVQAYANDKSSLSTSASIPSPRAQAKIPQQRSPFGTQPPYGTTNSDPFPILSTTVYDHSDNSTTMEFTNIQVNSRVSNSLFDFFVPGNVQVIRPSERNLPR